MIRNERGQSMVEFALILPLLLLLLVGIFDFGRVLYTHMHLHLTTQESVRLAGFGTQSDAEVKQFTYNHFRGNSDLLEVVITPRETERRAGDYVTVQLNYEMDFFTPGIRHVLPSPHIARSSSTIRVERVGSQ